MANNFLSIIYYVISMIVLQSNLNFLKSLKIKMTKDMSVMLLCVKKPQSN